MIFTFLLSIHLCFFMYLNLILTFRTFLKHKVLGMQQVINLNVDQVAKNIQAKNEVV